jgi:ribosomal protein S18 acetylase RimI-like enzyme
VPLQSEQRARDNVVMAIAGINFVATVDEIADDDLEGFFAGWKQPPSRRLHLAVLRASDRAVIAQDAETQAVVGFVSAISDGLIAAYITLLEVRPAYQRRGIGTELLRRMLDALEPLYMIDALCDERLLPFYQRAGFTRGVAVARRNPAAIGER